MWLNLRVIDQVISRFTMEKALNPQELPRVDEYIPSREHFIMQDDKEMLRAARNLTKGLGVPKPNIYWPDMILSVGIGFGALAGAVVSEHAGVSVILGLLSALGLYRALMFIHELTHVPKNTLPGFRIAWNLLVGIPLLVPSFMYEGVHTLHHKRTQYGTKEDPEYLPLALMHPWSLPAFLLVALLAPLGLLFRFSILLPIGVIFSSVRKFVWEQASSLKINPDFRRKAAEPKVSISIFWQEFGGFVWSWCLIASIFIFGPRPLLIFAAVASLTALINQLRTLVAHLWENDGEPMTVTAQFLDSVNVPPPGLLAEIWAPVGLRYHALHHLMPSMPYHDLPEAHRRLKHELGVQSTYSGANHLGLIRLIIRLARSTLKTKLAP